MSRAQVSYSYTHFIHSLFYSLFILVVVLSCLSFWWLIHFVCDSSDVDDDDVFITYAVIKLIYEEKTRDIIAGLALSHSSCDLIHLTSLSIPSTTLLFELFKSYIYSINECELECSHENHTFFFAHMRSWENSGKMDSFHFFLWTDDFQRIMKKKKTNLWESEKPQEIRNDLHGTLFLSSSLSLSPQRQDNLFSVTIKNHELKRDPCVVHCFVVHCFNTTDDEKKYAEMNQYC